MLDGKVIDSEKGALALLENIIYRDVFIIAINEVFTIISLLFILSMLFLPFTTNVKASND